MTIHEAITQLVNTGEKDPLTIARKIMKRYDEEWLQKELLALAEDVLADIARHELGRVRRSMEVALRPGDVAASANIKTAKVWVPGSGFKRAADVTQDDALAIARWYHKAGTSLFRRSAWWYEVVGVMKEQAVTTLGMVKGALPPLPDDEALDLPALGAA